MLLIIILLLFFSVSYSQNTVGLIYYNEDLAHEGYNLIYPHNQSNTYLINNCGEIVHRWDDEEHFRPGNSAYLLENGNLLKTKRPAGFVSETFTAGGAGGIVEMRTWDNNLLWTTTAMDSVERMHHDIASMPNGNILAIIWERKFLNELVDAGRDTSLIEAQELWPDFIREYNPFTDEVVWEWHAWDHIIQDYDSLKNNFGTVKDHPELIDLNYDLNGLGGRPDWMHANSIDYNPDLDQILLSVAFFEEVWIIDHSTSTEEASSHAGGRSGKGGDLLYRWGNPRAYKSGSFEDQQLHFQHNAHWIDDSTLSSSEFYNQIAIFNNRYGADFSSLSIINPGMYSLDNNRFLPEDYSLNLFHPEPTDLYASGMSSLQLLPNDNFLVCSAREGYTFEMTLDQEIVWEYILPLSSGQPAPQGEEIFFGDNVLFRIERYDSDYNAFKNRDLLSQGFLELEPNLTFCNTTANQQVNEEVIEVWPNPVTEHIHLSLNRSCTVSILSTNNELVYKEQLNAGLHLLSSLELIPGIYFLKVDKSITKIVVL